MARRLLNLLTALSLLLCVAASGLWVRGRFVEDLWTRWTTVPGSRGDAGGGPEEVQDFVISGNGRLVVGTDRYRWLRQELAGNPAPGWRYGPRPAGNPYRSSEWTGWRSRVPVQPYHKSYANVGWSVRSRGVEIHYWLVALLTAVLPASAARGIINRWRRRAPGLCRRCGYDLRATPGRCPECGTEAA